VTPGNRPVNGDQRWHIVCLQHEKTPPLTLASTLPETNKAAASTAAAGDHHERAPRGPSSMGTKTLRPTRTVGTCSTICGVSRHVGDRDMYGLGAFPPWHQLLTLLGPALHSTTWDWGYSNAGAIRIVADARATMTTTRHLLRCPVTKLRTDKAAHCHWLGWSQPLTAPDSP
jgi:hypothetical protein